MNNSDLANYFLLIAFWGSCIFIPDAKAQVDNKQQETEANRKKTSELWQSTLSAIRKSDYKAAEKKLSELVKLPDPSNAYYYRGRVRFQAGDIKGSVADFDKHVELSPKLKTRQWERGIALYYAGKFKEGSKQFEIYQTYHSNDVENSAWRFLCDARAFDIDTARKNLLPIRDDRRVPMMQIYSMFQGKKTPEQVLKAAEDLSSDFVQLKSAKFYANLYVGLLYEVEGKGTLAKKHLLEARKHKIDHYMWDVANIHVKLIEASEKRQGDKNSQD